MPVRQAEQLGAHDIPVIGDVLLGPDDLSERPETEHRVLQPLDQLWEREPGVPTLEQVHRCLLPWGPIPHVPRTHLPGERPQRRRSRLVWGDRPSSAGRSPVSRPSEGGHHVVVTTYVEVSRS